MTGDITCKENKCGDISYKENKCGEYFLQRKLQKLGSELFLQKNKCFNNLTDIFKHIFDSTCDVYL